MTNPLIELTKRNLVTPPQWLPTNTMYLTVVGSHAYGVADTTVRDKIPDYDVYGWTIPPKTLVFPHLSGHIRGFGPEPQNFDKPFQKHHVIDPDANAGRGKEWDFTIYGIVAFFELCRENNPNILDSLYTPEHCVLHCTQIGRKVRDKRHLFLSKLCWKKYRGYASAQLRKAVGKKPEGTRREIIERYGFDVKFLYNIIRLYDQAEQILLEGTMDLQRAREIMKAVRAGEWSLKQVQDWVYEKDKALEAIYPSCQLPEQPPIEPIKQLLISCLEEHYGSIQECVNQTGWAENALQEIDSVLNNVRSKLYG